MKLDMEYNISMLALSTQISGTPIMSLQNGGELGIAEKAIIDPRKLQVIAYYATGSRILETSVLHTSDIRELGPLGIIVDSADSIMVLDEDLVRLQEVVNLNFELIGLQVIDDTKQKLGKIVDYTLETDGFYIQKIHVSQSMLKNITNTNLIIHRSQIIEITDTKVIVKSATIKQSTKISQMINPFRKTTSLVPDQVNQKNP